jgi:hypothetical protein
LSKQASNIRRNNVAAIKNTDRWPNKISQIGCLSLVTLAPRSFGNFAG